MTALSLEEGQLAISRLVIEFLGETVDLNEADTRHRFIDRLIHECLGWERTQTRVERQYNGQYSDYELGTPPVFLIEAKRTGIPFAIPNETTSGLMRSLRSLCGMCTNFKTSFEQAQKYCSERGIQIGSICNGNQIIIFLAVRTDGIPPSEGKCLLFNGLEQIEGHFPKLWQAMSSTTDAEWLQKELRSKLPSGLPHKLSNHLQGYPKFRYPSESQQSLRTLSDLLIEDAPNTVNVRKRFYEECYCENGALAKESLVGKSILAARYAAMFDPAFNSPSLQGIRLTDQNRLGFSSEVVAEALGRRPIVIIGDVGVGKTSFIRHLVYVRASKEIENTIFIYIDLGSDANLGQNIYSYFLDEIERQLLNNFAVDLYEDKFVRGIYHSELQRFEKGIYATWKESAPEKFLDKQIECLEQLTANKFEHLKRSIQHISKGRKKQIVISIDNADQRKYQDQQDAFLAAQEFSAKWDALVLISLRPQTYFASKASGSISGYPQRILTISPPRVDQVLLKRLEFSLDLAEGKLPLDRLEGISIKLDSITLFLKALLFSLRNNKEIVELLSNITGGNIREALGIVKGFIGSANIDSEKIIAIMRSQGEYMISLHEFTKQALLGEYSHYHSRSSLAFNLFDTRYPEPKEHFLSLLIVAFLLSDDQHKSPEGFIESTGIIREMQGFGFIPDQIEHTLRRLTNKKLVETTERITFDEGLEGLIGDMPLAFRATTIGAYHVQVWACEFSYIDAMLFDTPIFDSLVRDYLFTKLNSFDICDRYDRATAFACYLDKIWKQFPSFPVYFDWQVLRKSGEASFSAVGKVVSNKRK